MHVVRYACKALVGLLRLPLRKLLEIAFKFPREFLQGFFDAEGHVDVGVGKQFRLAVGVDNSNKSLLLRVKQLLKELGIPSRLERKRKAGTVMVIRGVTFVKRRTAYDVVIGEVDYIRDFAKEIGFSIRRKNQKLKDALSIIATYVPRTRPAMWNQMYSKIGGEWVRKRELKSLNESKSIKVDLWGLP